MFLTKEQRIRRFWHKAAELTGMVLFEAIAIALFFAIIVWFA